MSNKQEKLAAARKKLKEFQGRNRENGVNRTKDPVSSADVGRKLSGSGTSTDTISSSKLEQDNIDDTSPEMCHSSHLESHNYKTEDKVTYNYVREMDSSNHAKYAFPSFPASTFTQNVQQYVDPYVGCTDIPNPTNNFEKEIIVDSCIRKLNITNAAPSNHANGLFASEINVPCKKVEQHSVPDNNEFNKVKAEICTLFKDSDGYSAPEPGSNPPSKSQEYPLNSDPKEMFSSNLNDNPIESYGKSAFKSWEMQPSQTISELTEEKNSLMEVLKRTEELLKFKADQEQDMAKNVNYLQSTISDLEGRFLKAQREAEDLRMVNEKLMKQRDIDFKMLEDLHRKLNSREEQFSELQRKFDLKTKECEISNVKLKETDTQLASSLIKIQQLSLGDSYEANPRFCDLQNENSRLLGKILDLEKRLETLDREKEQSSQSFHSYAQLYDGQINVLSTEVRNLVKENQQLLEKNEVLQKNLKDLKREDSSSVPDQKQIAGLSEKLIQLTEENEILRRNLKTKVDAMEILEKENNEKSEEILRINSTLQGIKSEYMKQQEESSSHQKLLAAVESDKIAASRAVSQNYKLKEQVAELEKGFIKLSHEKLQLTEELSHEKYVRKELENRLQKWELASRQDPKHDHHVKTSDGTINESADIEELKNIIRQLEEDKTELLSRLNSSTSTKILNYSSDQLESETSDALKENPESSKLLLQQMEEKVKKTMNEIAALDEEKEKLEHLVLQLQSETETIGEYISLYQTQKMRLRQRNKEKDEQLMQLSKDKEELKSKLSTLNDLVLHLITEKAIDATEVTDVSSVMSKDNKEGNEDTAVKIQTLINEIQSTNLIDNQSVAFEHCPCCSGRLITI